MRIAFCTTVRNRTQHLKTTLPKNLADHSHSDAVFVVLDYDSQDDLAEYLRLHHSHDIASGRLVIYSYRNGGGTFKIAHAKNVAARCGIREGGNVLVTMDADNSGGPGFAKFVSESFHEPGVRPGIFLCPNYQLIKSMPHGALRPARGYAGRLGIWSQTFLKVGGYDEVYDCWGSEDIDLNYRLQRGGYAMRFIPNHYLNAINHNAEVRFKEYPHAQALYENNRHLEVIKARTETLVNYGKFGLGTVYRNFNTTPIELKPIPTRIFAIGMQRTGTSSLNEAFKILGFDSLHWGTGEAPMIWYEMNALDRSPTLEKFYAASDNPLPLLYRKLDKAYPGSLFILTVRDELEWLMSVRRLWNPRHNQNRLLWDVYPITHQIHMALYGQRDFDALVFLERYRRHNAEVLAYFKDRPRDLLIMKTGTGWAPLCGFLNRPIPSVPYPHKNRSQEEVDVYTGVDT